LYGGLCGKGGKASLKKEKRGRRGCGKGRVKEGGEVGECMERRQAEDNRERWRRDKGTLCTEGCGKGGKGIGEAVKKL
jgi:hypothetical protein